MFPVGHNVTVALRNELQDLLHWAHSDTLTSRLSTSPFYRRRLAAFSSLAKSVRGEDYSGRSFWAIARPFYFFKYKMLENYYGEPFARINVNQSVLEATNRSRTRTWTFLTFSFMLFGVPAQCFKKIEKIWVDDILYPVCWNEFLSDRRKEWEKTVTPATVLLSANVGLLAIASVDSESSSRSVAQVASYASVITSLGSYLIGHILTLQHSHELTGEELETEVADREYLIRMHEILRSKMKYLAIMYSLPSALFIWSMLEFLVAMTYVFFHDSDNASVTFLAILLGFLVLVVLWVIMLESAASSEEGAVREICASMARKLRKL